MNLAKLTLSDKALEALSYVIVTATEGGIYTREDFKEWTAYKHGDTDKGFRAEVTVVPHDDVVEGVDATPVRLTPDELGRRLWSKLPTLVTNQNCACNAVQVVRLLAGDDDVAGEMDVVDSGAALQVAVYGEIVFG